MSNRLFLGETDRIPSYLAPSIRQEIMDKILSYFPDLGYEFIGSVGKKKDTDTNGDIDIAILCDNTQQLEMMIKTVFGELSSYTVENLYIVSIKYPYTFNDEVKYAQCDFMVMHNPEYTKFRYYCPDYRKDESKYKVSVKIMLTNMVLNHCKEKNDNLLDDEIGQFDYRSTGLYKFVYKKDLSKYKEVFITYSPTEIAGYIFKDSDTSHFNTVESLWKELHTNNFKYPEELKEIEKNWFKNCWRKGWTSVIPEDFNIQYWSLEDIHKIMDEQKMIHKINSLAYEDI